MTTIDYDRVKQKIVSYSHGTITSEEADRMISTLLSKQVEKEEEELDKEYDELE